MLGFLTLAFALALVVTEFSPGSWALFAVVPLWLAVVTAGVEALSPQRWMGPAKWGLLAASAVVFGVGSSVVAYLFVASG